MITYEPWEGSPTMFMEERHREILKTIQQKGRISVGEIRERFGVSVDSARRDLRILESRNLLKRAHGGAIPLGAALPKPYENQRSPDIGGSADAYDAIAKTACGSIGPHDTVYIPSDD